MSCIALVEHSIEEGHHLDFKNTKIITAEAIKLKKIFVRIRMTLKFRINL